jgi:hypothetical protein
VLEHLGDREFVKLRIGRVRRIDLGDVVDVAQGDLLATGHRVPDRRLIANTQKLVRSPSWVAPASVTSASMHHQLLESNSTFAT